jgi:hypothetical protein
MMLNGKLQDLMMAEVRLEPPNVRFQVTEAGIIRGGIQDPPITKVVRSRRIIWSMG